MCIRQFPCIRNDVTNDDMSRMYLFVLCEYVIDQPVLSFEGLNIIISSLADMSLSNLQKRKQIKDSCSSVFNRLMKDQKNDKYNSSSQC